VTALFAFECFADQDVFLFLRDHCKLPLSGRHSYGQGEVINDVLVRKRALVGIVDEDPGSSHHPLRDQMELLQQTPDLELRRRDKRYLFILKPALEGCFLRCMKRVGLKPQVAGDASELERRLANPEARHANHQRFRDDLRKLYDEARERKIATFLTELDDKLRTVLPDDD
jgi:hypothetical protein